MQMAEQIASAPAVTVKMAREVIRHLSVPAVRASMADEMIYQTFVNRSDDFAEFKAARASGERSPRTAAAEGSSWASSVCRRRHPKASPRSRPGRFDGSVVFVTGGGTGLGKAIAVEFGRLGAALVIASRDEKHLGAGHEALAAIGAPGGDRDLRHTATGSDRGGVRRGREGVRPARGSRQQRGGKLSRFRRRTCRPNAWRSVVDITLNGTFFCAREFARRHLAAGTPGSIVNVAASYAWTGGPGFAHSAAAKAGVKNLTETLAVEWAPYGIQVNALVPGLFPHEDMTADIRANLDRAGSVDNRQPALRVGQVRELGWAATFLASPYARFVSGHTLVVDGANWQRRTLTNPPFVTVRDQMGRPAFDPGSARKRQIKRQIGGIMLFVHEVHSVRGASEDAFEQAVHDGWMAALAKGDDARLALVLRPGARDRSGLPGGHHHRRARRQSVGGARRSPPVR